MCFLQLYVLKTSSAHRLPRHTDSKGRLQSLDWTSGLDWWTDTKNQDSLTYGVVWNPATFSVAVVLEQIIY